MTEGFDLLPNEEQTGSFNLNGTLVEFEVVQNEITKGYYMNLSIGGESLLDGQNLVDGNNMLYNRKSLDLGTRLEFLSYTLNGEEKWSLIYE